MEETLWGLLVVGLVTGLGIFLRFGWKRFLERKARLEDEHEANQDTAITECKKRLDVMDARLTKLDQDQGAWIKREEFDRRLHDLKKDLEKDQETETKNREEIDKRQDREIGRLNSKVFNGGGGFV